MKTDMRRELARQPFEHKIRKVGQLLELSTKLKGQRGTNAVESTLSGVRGHKAATRKIQAIERHIGIRRDPIIISAIRDKAVLKFIYNREPRLVEPQTYGLSTTGKEILRAHQISGGSRAGRSQMAKLFDLAKISGLEKTAQRFAQALPEHNPEDSAMVEIFATLPKPKR